MTLEACDCGSAQDDHGWACRCSDPPSKRKSTDARVREPLGHGLCPYCERRLRLLGGLIPPHKDSRSVWCVRVPVQPMEVRS